MPARWKPPSIRPLVTGLGIMLVVSGLFSLGELRYLLLSRKATAVVDSSTRISIRPGARSSQIVQAVLYHFREADGTARQGADRLVTYWLAPKAGDRVQVQYFPGRPGSDRLAGNGAKVMPSLFVLCLLGFVAVYVVLRLEQRKRSRHQRHHAPVTD